jgi:hypothetical protein
MRAFEHGYQYQHVRVSVSRLAPPGSPNQSDEGTRELKTPMPILRISAERSSR